MKIPINGGIITTPFDDPRPVSNPGLHKHGALDIAGGDRMVCAPCSGRLTAYVMVRNQGGQWLPAGQEKKEITDIIPRNYFYDTFGGVIFIQEENDTRFHLLTHFWLSSLVRSFGPLHPVESSQENRWAPIAMSSAGYDIERGDELCLIGNAGFSSGPHVHWEVHQGPNLSPHADRIHPGEYIK
jgi:hypothetical protein